LDAANCAGFGFCTEQSARSRHYTDRRVGSDRGELVTAIASTPRGHNAQPPPGPAEPPTRTAPAELAADGSIEDIMADWLVLSGVLNRVNNSMGRDDLYPFTIHPHLVPKLGFIHRVVTGAKN
jgi:hypothetical protein